MDQIYHLACPASPVHYKYNPVKTIKVNCWEEPVGLRTFVQPHSAFENLFEGSTLTVCMMELNFLFITTADECARHSQHARSRQARQGELFLRCLRRLLIKWALLPRMIELD